jgi:hypothetical protein
MMSGSGQKRKWPRFNGTSVLPLETDMVSASTSPSARCIGLENRRCVFRRFARHSGPSRPMRSPRYAPCSGYGLWYTICVP